MSGNLRDKNKQERHIKLVESIMCIILIMKTKKYMTKLTINSVERCYKYDKLMEQTLVSFSVRFKM